MSSNGESGGFAVSCPLPLTTTDRVLLGHGSGGKMTADLIARYFLPAFRNSYLERLDDQAVLTVGETRLAFTTDAYVVTPLFFPGGDIGMLAVNGTVNDLAMAGARPLYLSAAFILEEGFPLAELGRIVESMSAAARTAGVLLVTGDTKVVRSRQGRRVLHHDERRRHRRRTTGTISAAAARPGDLVILERRHRRARHGDHGRAGRPRGGDSDPERLGPAPRAGPGHARRRAARSIACETRHGAASPPR